MSRDDRKAGWIVTGVLVVLFVAVVASVWLGGVVFNWVMGGG
jgi:hypothetical protein